MCLLNFRIVLTYVPPFLAVPDDHLSYTNVLCRLAFLLKDLARNLCTYLTTYTKRVSITLAHHVFQDLLNVLLIV